MEIVRKRKKLENGYVRCGVGLCNGCDKEVALHGMTNECECGLLYNLFGQQLRKLSPTEYWEEGQW